MNPTAIRHLRRIDPVLDRLIGRVGPIRLKPRRLPPFESLVGAIIHQQLSGKAAGTIHERFKGLFPGQAVPTPERLLGIETETLRSVGLSRQKTTYVRDAAEKTVQGIVPTLEACDRLSDAELIERLTAIKGVGRWTVEMLLIFNLGRPDVWPVDDLGVRRGFQVAFRKRRSPTPKELDRIGERWRPYRSAVALYFWRAVDGND